MHFVPNKIQGIHQGYSVIYSIIKCSFFSGLVIILAMTLCDHVAFHKINSMSLNNISTPRPSGDCFSLCFAISSITADLIVTEESHVLQDDTCVSSNLRDFQLC